MKRKHSKYRKIWLLWVALEGLVATFAIMSSFLLLRYLYFSNGTAIPEASVSTAGSVLSAVYLPLLITLILTTGFLEHKLSANVTNLMDGLRAVAGGDYSVRLKTDKHQLLDDLCEDFNRMTEELQSVRTLREDFQDADHRHQGLCGAAFRAGSYRGGAAAASADHSGRVRPSGGIDQPDAAADKIAVPAVFAGSNHVFSG